MAAKAAKEDATLPERVQRLEDLEEIGALMARYASATNKGDAKVVEIEQMASIFASDATWEGPHLRVVGLEKIMESLRRSTASIEFSSHAFHNPILNLEGNVASGTWLLSIVGKRNGECHGVRATEDLTYVRTAMGWRIQTVRLHRGISFSLPEEGE